MYKCKTLFGKDIAELEKVVSSYTSTLEGVVKEPYERAPEGNWYCTLRIPVLGKGHEDTVYQAGMSKEDARKADEESIRFLCRRGISATKIFEEYGFNRTDVKAVFRSDGLQMPVDWTRVRYVVEHVAPGVDVVDMLYDEDKD